MPTACSVTGCKAAVPPEIESERKCVLHFLLRVEEACNEMRHEIIPGISAERRQQIIQYIAQHGEMLAKVSVSGLRMPDDLKGRILNSFLILINLRESVDRTLKRQEARK